MHSASHSESSFALINTLLSRSQKTHKIMNTTPYFSTNVMQCQINCATLNSDPNCAETNKNAKQLKSQSLLPMAVARHRLRRNFPPIILHTSANTCRKATHPHTKTHLCVLSSHVYPVLSPRFLSRKDAENIPHLKTLASTPPLVSRGIFIGS